MDKVVRTAGCWPTPEQELLLHAALDNREQAIPAWERYLAHHSLDQLQAGSMELLPQVHRNLENCGYQNDIVGRLKGYYQQALSRNQVLFQDMAPMVRSLHMAGIPTMLLKGVALSLAVYKDRGARPTRDFEVLVPANEADNALELFAQQGWRSAMGFAMRVTPSQERYRHAIELISPKGKKFHLHWHVLPQSRSANADAEFWKQAWPVYLDEDRSLTLPPTMQLVHSCAEGIQGKSPMPVSWVCDAMVTIRASKIDWEQFVALAHEHEVTLPLRDATRYLQDTFQAPIPRSVTWRLEKEPASPFARMEYYRHLQPDRQHSPLVTLVATYRTYRRGVRDLSLPRQLAGFPNYLVDVLQLPGVGHLPRHFARWCAQRLRRWRPAPAVDAYPADQATPHSATQG